MRREENERRNDEGVGIRLQRVPIIETPPFMGIIIFHHLYLWKNMNGLLSCHAVDIPKKVALGEKQNGREQICKESRLTWLQKAISNSRDEDKATTLERAFLFLALSKTTLTSTPIKTEHCSFLLNFFHPEKKRGEINQRPKKGFTSGEKPIVLVFSL